MDGRIDGWIDR